MDQTLQQRSPWIVIGQVAAALAVAMGIGRFVYTPILPMMIEQTWLDAHNAALLATMNYIGYLLGAVAGIVWPRLLHSRLVLRGSLVALVGSIAIMPVTESMVVWSAMRLIAGIGSALVFMVVVAAINYQLGPKRAHMAGWGLGGVGAGIALSGALVLAIRWTSTWAVAWTASAIMALLLSAVAWFLIPEPASVAAAAAKPTTGRRNPWFFALLASYTLEGVGYIIAGTFLVAAIDQVAADWVGSSAWIMVGLASVPSTVMWVGLSRRFTKVGLVTTALGLQAIGIALPAFFSSTGVALLAAALYGGTFVGIAILSINIGVELNFPRAVAVLTTGYSVGQILGPLIVAPMLREGYRTALLVGAAIVAVAMVAAFSLRFRSTPATATAGT